MNVGSANARRHGRYWNGPGYPGCVRITGFLYLFVPRRLGAKVRSPEGFVSERIALRPLHIPMRFDA